MIRHGAAPGSNVGVFVASTFSGLVAERDALVRFAMPEVRWRAKRAGFGVELNDLRWGAAADADDLGASIHGCLDAIDACRPWLVVLVGDAFGTVPKRLPADVRARLGADYDPDASITELEVAYYAARQTRCDGCFVFVRRGTGAAAPNERLVRLVESLRERGATVDAFRDPEELARLFVERFARALVGEFVADDSETAVQDAEAARAAPGGAEISQAVAAVEEALRAPGRIAVVRGPPGRGKSSTLLAWLRARSVSTDGDAPFVLAHFADLSADSTRIEPLLRRWCRQLTGRDVSADGDEAEAELRVLFADALRRAAAPVLIALDGVDRLETAGSGDALGFLPVPLPAGVVVLTSADADFEDEGLRRRCAVDVELSPLPVQRREERLRDGLRGAGKTPSPKVVAALVHAPCGGEPEFVAAAVDLLRDLPSETAVELAAHRLAAAADIVAAREVALGHFESAYGRELVRDFFGLLLCARGPLAEAELEALLARKGVEDDRRAALRSAVDGLVAASGGFVRAGSRSLVDAARRRYELAAPSVRGQFLARLAAYFSSSDRPPARQAAEAPWHLLDLGRISEVAEYVTRPEVAVFLYEQAPRDWFAFYRRFADDPSFGEALRRRTEDWAQELGEYAPALLGRALLAAARALHESGSFAELAAELMRRALKRFEDDGDAERADVARNGLAAAYDSLDRFDDSLRLHRETLVRRLRSKRPTVSVAVSLSNAGHALQRSGRPRLACALYRRLIDRVRADVPVAERQRWIFVNNFALALAEIGSYEGALPLFREAREGLALAACAADRDALRFASNEAFVLASCGRFDEAESAYRSVVRRLREAYGPNEPLIYTAENNLGDLVGRRGDLDASFELLKGALEGRLRLLGANHRDTLQSAANVALCGMRAQRLSFRDARSLAMHSLRGRRRRFGPDSLETVNGAASLAGVLAFAERACSAALAWGWVYERRLASPNATRGAVESARTAYQKCAEAAERLRRNARSAERR